MSSSTMIQGATAWRVKTYRIPVETTTRPTSQAQTGTARANVHARDRARPATAASTAKPDLVESRRELGRRRIVHADADAGGRLGDVVQHRVPDRLAAGRLLQRGRVPIGHSAERVVALGDRPRGGPHRLAELPVSGEPLERRGQRLDLPLVDGNAGRRLVRKPR